MFKFNRTIHALVGPWLATVRLKVEASAGLDIKNAPPLGLLRGHLHDSRLERLRRTFRTIHPERNTPVNPFGSRAAES